MFVKIIGVLLLCQVFLLLYSIDTLHGILSTITATIIVIAYIIFKRKTDR